MLGEHVLDALQALGVVGGGDNMALQARVGIMLTRRSARYWFLY